MDELNAWIVNNQDYMLQLAINLVFAIVIFYVGRMLARWLSAMSQRLMEKREIDKAVASFVRNVVYVTLLTIVVISAASQLGINTNSLVAVIGAAGLAIGLALQGSLSNFASGVLIVTLKPFKSGDFVQAGGVSGVVSEIHIFSTVLITPDNKKIILPNASITGSPITNFSSKDTRRIDLVIGIGYDADLKHAKQVLTDILDAHELVLDDPKPVVGVLELADSSVNLVVRPWVKTADYWVAHFGIMEQIKLRFNEEDISIPYPQMDIHLSKQES